jgi:hypothetical protein
MRKIEQKRIDTSAIIGEDFDDDSVFAETVMND